MSEHTHLLLDGADRYPINALPPLPGLQRALQHWQIARLFAQEHDAPLTPAEALHAELLGTPGTPGHHPFAALAHGVVGQACGWVTPCHIQLGMDRAQLDDPRHLNLDDETSRELMAAVTPLFKAVGLQLSYESPLRWLATGELLRDAHCRSLAQAIAQPLRLDALAPRTSHQPEASRRQLQRLLNEVQMLLYTHPLTDARAARRLPAVNAVWLHGAGALPESTTLVSPRHTGPLLHDTRLLEAAEQGPQAWAKVWLELDQELPARLDEWQRHAPLSTFSLCGQHHGVVLQPRRTGLAASWLRRLRPAAPMGEWLGPLHLGHNET